MIRYCLLSLFSTLLILITIVNASAQSATSTEAKIKSAVSAAPASVSNNATIKNWKSDFRTDIQGAMQTKRNPIFE